MLGFIGTVILVPGTFLFAVFTPVDYPEADEATSDRNKNIVFPHNRREDEADSGNEV